MSHLRKRASKLATLDAARTVYFIIVGLAIKQSLGLFSHEWPNSTIRDAPYYWTFFDRLLVGLGYIATVLRFSHGVSQLHGYEKERVETSGLPSSGKVLRLSVFLVLLGMFFYLMVDNITQLSTYIFLTAIMLAIDFLYIVSSQVIRCPFSMLIRRVWNLIINRVPGVKVKWDYTVPGYQAHAALQWMASDIILVIVCLLYTLVRTTFHDEVQFALFLFLATVWDYIANRELYFGGRKDKRKQKIVFICSPLAGHLLQPMEEDLLENIRRAQMYCSTLMEKEGKIPYASHCFYTYFLNENDPLERILGRNCALAFLSACDAIHVYIPFTRQSFGKYFKFIERERPDFSQVSSGMRQEINEASKLGLEIKYKRAIAQLPTDWKPKWSPLGYKKQESRTTVLEGTENRKRVYVCTQLRGLGFSTLTSEQQKQRLQENIRAALWYCHELVRSTTETVAPFAPQAFYRHWFSLIGTAK